MSINQSNKNLFIFTKIKIQMRLLGILHIELPERYQFIPVTFIQRTVVIGFLSIAIIKSVGFSLYETQNRSETMKSFCFCSAFTYGLLVYMLAIQNHKKLEIIADTIQSTIEDRMFQLTLNQIQMACFVVKLIFLGIAGSNLIAVEMHYRKTNKFIETKLGGLVNLALLVSIPLWFVPFLCVSYYNYFMLDLAEESFHLIYPAK